MRHWYKNVQLLWWIILAMGLLNLTILLSISVFKHKPACGTVSIGSCNMPCEESQQLNANFFINKVGFNSEQMGEYAKLHDAYVKEVFVYRKNIEEINNALLVSMKKNWESYDTTLLDDVSRAHYNLKAVTANYYVNIRKIANSHQLPIIDKAFKPIFSGLSRSDSWNKKKTPKIGNNKTNKPFIH